MSAICPLGGGLSPGYAFVVKSRPPSKAQSKGIDETRSSQNLEGGRRYGTGCGCDQVEDGTHGSGRPMERSHAPKLKIVPGNGGGIGDDVAVVYNCRAEVDHNLRVAPRV